jgi:hypothetical protein
MAETATLKPLADLPLKHQLFIVGCMVHKGDKTKAARHAGYSPKSCMEQGQQLYRKLQGYIEPMGAIEPLREPSEPSVEIR